MMRTRAAWRVGIRRSAPPGLLGVGICGWLLLSSLVSAPGIVLACPGCKEALFDPAQLSQRLSAAKGYALSIALLLAVPALLVGGITALVIRARIRRRSSGI